MPFIATKNSEQHLTELRRKRDLLLAATDWVYLPDANLAATDLETVAAYRSSLRDCTKTAAGQQALLPNFEDTTMPEKIKAGLRRVKLD